MSLERFESMYPSGTELRQIIDRQRLRDRSPIVTLALNLANEAGNGLRETSAKFNRSDTQFPLDRESILRIPREYRDEIRKLLGAVAFGITIPSIDHILWNKEFQHRNWVSEYSLRISGTMFTPIKLTEERVDVIPDDQWRESVSLANNDKTLDSFFEAKNKHLIPQAIIRFINYMGLDNTIYRDIRPLYYERAKYLISQPQ